MLVFRIILQVTKWMIPTQSISQYKLVPNVIFPKHLCRRLKILTSSIKFEIWSGLIPSNGNPNHVNCQSRLPYWEKPDEQYLKVQNRNWRKKYRGERKERKSFVMCPLYLLPYSPFLTKLRTLPIQLKENFSKTFMTLCFSIITRSICYKVGKEKLTFQDCQIHLFPYTHRI